MKTQPKRKKKKKHAHYGKGARSVDSQEARAEERMPSEVIQPSPSFHRGTLRLEPRPPQKAVPREQDEKPALGDLYKHPMTLIFPSLNIFKIVNYIIYSKEPT